MASIPSGIPNQSGAEERSETGKGIQSWYGWMAAERIILRMLVSPGSKVSPAMSACRMMRLFIDISREQVLTETKTPAFLTAVSIIISRIASKFPSHSREQDQLSQFVVEFGRYLYQAPASGWELYSYAQESFIKSSVGRLIDPCRGASDEDLLKTPWDKVHEWIEVRVLEKWALFHNVKQRDISNLGNALNYQSFLARLTRDGSVDFTSEGITWIGLVLESQTHPDGLFYHPVAVAKGMYAGEVTGSGIPELPLLQVAECMTLAEERFRIAVCWIKIAGNELFSTYPYCESLREPLFIQRHISCGDRWIFWIRRFEDIAKSTAASKELQDMALGAAEHMKILMGNDAETMENRNISEFTNSENSQPSAQYNFEHHLVTLSREFEDLQRFCTRIDHQQQNNTRAGHASTSGLGLQIPRQDDRELFAMLPNLRDSYETSMFLSTKLDLWQPIAIFGIPYTTEMSLAQRYPKSKWPDSWDVSDSSDASTEAQAGEEFSDLNPNKYKKASGMSEVVKQLLEGMQF